MSVRGLRRSLLGTGRALAIFLGAVLFSPQPAVSAPAPGDLAQPPEWQSELAAAEALRTSAALAPARDAAEAARRDSELTRLFAELARKYPDCAPVQKAAGDLHWEKGEPEAAYVDWQRAQALDPHDAATASALGSAELRVGEIRAARDQFQRAVTAQPTIAQYHFELANVLYLFRHELIDPPVLSDAEAVLGAALQQFRLACELAPQDARLAQAYAETFYLQAHPDWLQALAAWTAVRALTGPNADFANSHLARISLRRGQPDQADGYLALITDSQFADLKAKLHQQAEALRRQPLPSPAPLPLATERATPGGVP